MSSYADTIRRLEEWAQDEMHIVQSVRHHEPQYANPAALRRDVRALLAEIQQLRDALALIETLPSRTHSIVEAPQIARAVLAAVRVEEAQ